MRHTFITIAIASALLLPVGISAKAPKRKAKTAETKVEQKDEKKDSIQAIYDKAKAGDAKCQNEVGIWYYSGKNGLDKDYEKAAKWWALSAKQENPQAIGNLGLCYQTGKGVKADSIKAFELYVKSVKKGNEALLKQKAAEAKKGNIFDNVLMGYCYEEGIGLKKSNEKAIPYYTAAGDKGSVTAIRRLGMIYKNQKDPGSAAKWFAKGEKANDLTCTYWYGVQLLKGEGVRKDARAGADLLLKAANAGMPQAMYQVGLCYLNGNGFMPNKEQGRNWLVKAAGKGVVTAQWDLAQIYRIGDGVPVNYSIATRYYAKAVSKLSNKFQNLITDSIPDSPYVKYLNGLKAYEEKDFEAALKCFKAVEKAKVIDGKVMQGVVMANKNYDKGNAKKGAKLLAEGVKAGDPEAAYLLATLYEVGRGVDQDMTKALELLNSAAEANYGPAECALADIFFEGRTIDRDYAAAFALYNKAYEQGDLTANAAKRLAQCYQDGLGVEADKELAAKILKGNYSSPVPALLKLVK